MSFQICRRAVLRAFGAALVAPTPNLLFAQESNLETAINQAICDFMKERNVPGGTVAIVDGNQLLFARAYGLADRENSIAAQTKSKFRIASLSKPITALGILKLVEQQTLSLDARFYDLLKIEPFTQNDRQFDDRVRDITVRQLLQHTAGWDRNAAFDPMFAAVSIATTLGIGSPPSPTDIIRFMLGRPLDFEPGTKHCYSNFGYCILGRLIERISGMSYEEFILEEILQPCGAATMQLGKTLHSAEDEVCYYVADDSKGTSVFAAPSGEVPWPYGGFCLESMDAHGGWIASVLDLANLMAALSDRKNCPILSEDSLREMFLPPPPPMQELPNDYYGCGWDVRRHADKTEFTYDHSGSLPGTMSVMFHRWDGISWIVLFNQRSEDDKLPDHDIERIVNTTIDQFSP